MGRRQRDRDFRRFQKEQATLIKRAKLERLAEIREQLHSALTEAEERINEDPDLKLKVQIALREAKVQALVDMLLGLGLIEKIDFDLAHYTNATHRLAPVLHVEPEEATEEEDLSEPKPEAAIL